MNYEAAVAELRDLPNPPQIYAICSGAGAGLQRLLWSAPGCSRFFVGAAFPYAVADMARVLGFAPPESCSEMAAIHLAMKAYARAWAGRGSDAPCIGLGLTAVASTNRHHRGEHRVHVATVTDDGVAGHVALLPKPVADPAQFRDADGEICDRIGLHALRAAAKLSAWDDADLLEKIQSIEHHDGGGRASAALFGERPWFRSDGTRAYWSQLHGRDYVHFPGTFNPPHAGHFGIAKAAAKMAHKSVLFSIEAMPPHKAQLTVTAALQRAEMLRGHNVVFTLGLGLYADKAAAFPGATFVMGSDTAERILGSGWGATGEETLEAFRKNATSILLVERPVDGRVVRLGDLGIPAAYRGSFRVLPGHWEGSSTEERARREGGVSA